MLNLFYFQEYDKILENILKFYDGSPRSAPQRHLYCKFVGTLFQICNNCKLTTVENAPPHDTQDLDWPDNFAINDRL